MTKPYDSMTKIELVQQLVAKDNELCRLRNALFERGATHRSPTHVVPPSDVRRYMEAHPERKCADAPVIAAWCAANPN